MREGRTEGEKERAYTLLGFALCVYECEMNIEGDVLMIIDGRRSKRFVWYNVD